MNERGVLRAPATLRSTHGVLVLTNRQLYFEHTSGIVSRRGFTALILPLMSIKNVKVERGLVRSKLVLIAQGKDTQVFPGLRLM